MRRSRSRRPRVVLAALVLGVSGLGAAGCATRNGSVAAFCAQLPKTPSVMSLYSLASTSSVPEAVARISSMAESMRELERVAPRAIRGQVATTADFAEHLADELKSLPATDLAVVTVPTAPGGVIVPPDSGPVVLPGGARRVYQDAWTDRSLLLADVFNRYPGAVSATYRFVSYAKDHCGAAAVPRGFDTNDSIPDQGLNFPN